MVDILHPAYHEDVQRGKPSRATVGTTTYEIDDGMLSIEDEAEATQVMARLADTYGVTYDDDGTIVSESTATAAASAAGDDETTDEGTESAPGGDSDDTADDDEGDTDAYGRDALEAMEHDDLKDVAADVGVDTDAVDMRSSENVVAAILQQQSDGVESDESAGE